MPARRGTGAGELPASGLRLIAGNPTASDAREGASGVHRILTGIGLLAAIVLISASATMNYLFMSLAAQAKPGWRVRCSAPSRSPPTS